VYFYNHQFCHRNFLTNSGHQIEKNEIDGAYKRYGETAKVYTGFWWGNLKERYHFEDPGVDGRIILRWIFRKWDVEVWTGSSWLRIGRGGGHL